MKFRTVVLTVATAVAVQLLAGLLIWRFLPDWPARGDFGSMFGAVSALFSGLALAGVIYAILLQRAELALQREELKLTREELARSASAQEESVSLLRQQLALATAARQDEALRRRADAAARLGSPGLSKTGTPERVELSLTMRNFGGPMRQFYLADVGAASPASLNPEFFVASGEQLTFLGTYRKEPKVIQFHVSLSPRDDPQIFASKSVPSGDGGQPTHLRAVR